jgi:hypothetical protein
MSRCTSLTRNGDQCALAAPPGSAYCYGHDPDRANERSRNAAKAARAKHAPSEMAAIKAELRDVIGAIRGGQIARSTATPLVMAYNTLLRAVEIERRIEEDEELLARLEALEAEARDARW